MTYIQAVENNKKFDLPKTWKKTKEIGDGKYHRWVKSPDGKIGFVLKMKSDEVAVAYPTKLLKTSYYFTTEIHKADWIKGAVI